MAMSTSEHVSIAAKSGLSIAAYARQNGLSVRSLYKAKEALGQFRKSAGHKQFLQVVRPLPSKEGQGPLCQIILSQESIGLWSASIKAMRTKDIVSLVGMVESCEVLQK